MVCKSSVVFVMLFSEKKEGSAIKLCVIPLFLLLVEHIITMYMNVFPLGIWGPNGLVCKCILVFRKFTYIPFYISSFLGFHTAYYNKEGVMITNPLMCAKHYVKTNFLYEFLANVLPTDVFAFISKGMILYLFAVMY